MGKISRTKRIAMGGTKAHSPWQNQNLREQNELSSWDSADRPDYDNGSTGNASNIKYKMLGGKNMRFLNKKGMEMVQVAILVAIAVTLGLIFKEQITSFVNNTFGSLNSAKF